MGRIWNSGCRLWGSYKTGRDWEELRLFRWCVSALKINNQIIKQKTKNRKEARFVDSFWRLLLFFCFKWVTTKHQVISQQCTNGHRWMVMETRLHKRWRNNDDEYGMIWVLDIFSCGFFFNIFLVKAFLLHLCGGDKFGFCKPKEIYIYLFPCSFVVDDV